MPAEQGPIDPGWAAERFAEALERGTPPGSVDDADLAQDLRLAAMLSARGDALAPHPDAKARARRQLLARVAAMDAAGPATLVADSTAAGAADAPTTVIPAIAPVEPPVTGDAATHHDLDRTGAAPLTRAGRRSRHAMPSHPAGRARTGGRSAGRGLGRRVLLIGAAALLAVVALAGGGMFASRTALPGDPLYPVKRIAEAAGLAMTFDDTAKARRQLELATTRLDEVEQLAARERTATDPELIRSTMTDFDSYTGAGSRSLLSSDAAGGAAALGDLRAWAGEQVSRLSVLRSTLPAPVLPGADNSINLLDRLVGRAEALGDRSSCTEIVSGVVDDLGPLPAQGACTPVPGGAAAPQGNAGRSGPASRNPARSGPAVTGPGDPSPVPGSQAPATGDGTGLLPNTAGTPTGSAPRTTSKAPSGGNVEVPLPLPLVPSVQLPPLVPGQPGVTIG